MSDNCYTEDKTNCLLFTPCCRCCLCICVLVFLQLHDHCLPNEGECLTSPSNSNLQGCRLLSVAFAGVKNGKETNIQPQDVQHMQTNASEVAVVVLSVVLMLLLLSSLMLLFCLFVCWVFFSFFFFQFFFSKIKVSILFK